MSSEVTEYVEAVYGVVRDAWTYEEIITDECARVIAAWWHSPGKPNSTALSTMGVVRCDTSLNDFSTQEEYNNANPADRMCLEALDQYIQHMQNTGQITHHIDCEHMGLSD